MLQNPQKFIFETAFDQIDTKGPTKLELEYQRGVEEGKLDGHTEGYQKAMDSIDFQTLNVLQTVRDEMEQVLLQFDAIVEANTRYSIDLVKKIAQKLFLDLPETTLIERALKILENTLPIVIEQRRLVFYVNPKLVDSLTKRLNESQDLKDILNRIDIQGSDLLENSECRIAWSKGSLDVNPSQTWQKIDGIINKYITITTAETDETALPTPTVIVDMETEPLEIKEKDTQHDG